MANGMGFTYMIVTQVLFFIFTIGLIIWLLKDSKQKKSDTPKDILDKRLVSGEVNLKKYNTLLKTINYSEVKK